MRAAATRRPSTALVWPEGSGTGAPDGTCHNRTVPSIPAVASSQSVRPALHPPIDADQYLFGGEYVERG
jgi:hypothetical protein